MVYISGYYDSESISFLFNVIYEKDKGYNFCATNFNHNFDVINYEW